MAANASALTGVYVNGQIGYADQSAKGELLSNGTSATDLTERTKRQGAWSTALGYNFDLDEAISFGAEFGYGYYGRTIWQAESGSVDGFAKIKQSAWTLLFTAGYHFDEMFGAYFKAGPAFGSSDVRGDNSFSFDGAVTDESYNKTLPMIVLGGTFNIMPELAVNLEWQHIFVAELTQEQPNRFQTVNAIMAGLTYTFEV